jgi:hypothetical protein
MTQVYVSRIRYAHAGKEYETAKRYRDVQRRLLTQIRAEAAVDSVSRQTLVREELNALVAEAKLDLAFAARQAALAYARSTMGLEPIHSVNADMSVAELAASLRSSPGVSMVLTSDAGDRK